MDADEGQRVIDLGRFDSADEAKAGSIRTVPLLDRAYFLLHLDRKNLDPFNRGRHVGELVALFVASPCQSGARALVPWGWRPERQWGLRLCLRSRRLRVLLLRSTPLQLPPWLVLSRLRPYSRS